MQSYRPSQRRARTHTALRWARRNSLWLAALLLAGCATYQPHPIEPGALPRSFEQRSLDDPALQRYIAAHLDGAPPPAGVWTPATLTLAAFYFSPELDLARARYATRQAAIGTAAQRPNPALLLPLGYTVSGGASPYLYGLGLDIPIETAGNEIEGPMAVVILGGLATSTILNLLALPVLAARFARFGAGLADKGNKALPAGGR